MLWLVFITLAFFLGAVFSSTPYLTYQEIVLELFYRIQEQFPELKEMRCEVYTPGIGVRTDAPTTGPLKRDLQSLRTVRDLAALLSEHLIVSELKFEFGTCLGTGIVRITGYDYLGQVHEFVINPLLADIAVH